MANRYVAGRRQAPVRGDARLRRHRPDGAHNRRDDHVPVHRRDSWSRCRRSTPTSRSSTPRRPTARATSSSGASPGCRRRRCWRAKRSLVTVERIVDELEPRPGGVVIPSWVIDAVAEAPGGSRPSYSLGITERDNDFYKFWDKLSRDRDEFRAWMDENVLGGARNDVSVTDSRLRRQATAPAEIADGRRGAPAARRARIGLHRRRPAEHRRDPRPRCSTTPTSCSSTSRGRSAPSRSASRSRSATANLPRPPTSSSRCRRCSTTGSAPGGSTSPSSAPPRSTATPT